MSRPAFPLLALLTAGTALGGFCLPAAAQTSVVLDTVTVEADGSAADGTGTGTGAAESATGPVNGYVAKRTTTVAKGRMVTAKLANGKTVTYNCSLAGNKTKAACK